jgi:hypothetical protein
MTATRSSDCASDGGGGPPKAGERNLPRSSSVLTLLASNMPLRRDYRFRLVPALLALAAMVILLGLAVHGHHDACHDYCWLCHLSLTAISLPTSVVRNVTNCSPVHFLEAAEVALPDPYCLIPSSPRAPPIV